MEDIKLYGHPLSGHTHKVSLFLSILELEYEFEIIDLKTQQQKSEAFLNLNPQGQIPVLVHGEHIICDSNAILFYLAKTFDRKHHWYPTSVVEQAEIHRLLSIAAGPLTSGPATVSAIKLLGKKNNLDEALQVTQSLYLGLELLLSDRTWMASNEASIADIALYSYIKLAEGATSIGRDFPRILNWQKQVESLPGFMAVA